MAAQAPCRCRQLGGRPGGSRRPALHLHAPAAKLVAHAATKPIDQKLYSDRNTASSKRRHAFSSCGTKWVKIYHRRSTDSAVAIGLRLRDKAHAALLTAA